MTKQHKDLCKNNKDHIYKSNILKNVKQGYRWILDPVICTFYTMVTFPIKMYCTDLLAYIWGVGRKESKFTKLKMPNTPGEKN